jgi:hypothetical protein
VPYDVGFTYLGPPVGHWGLIINHPTLSYKRLGWTPLSSVEKRKGSSKTGLSTIQLSSPLKIGYYA